MTDADPPDRAVAVVIRGDQVLLVERHREGVDYAVLPGGGVEAGETPAVAALRELAEETSLSGVAGEVLWVREDGGRRATYVRVLEVSGTLLLGGPEAARSSPRNAYHLRWAAAEELDRLDLRPAALRPDLRELLTRARGARTPPAPRAEVQVEHDGGRPPTTRRPVTDPSTTEPVALFDGHSLAGWHAVPRLPVPRQPGGTQPDRDSDAYRRALVSTGDWSVEDGAIVGRQSVPGEGGYLVSDATYGDVELTFEARPDWPADTGILLRATPIGSQGFQVLLDHRRSGNIGGFYGNGVGGVHAINFTLDVARDATGHPTGLVLEDPARTLEPLTEDKRRHLRSAASGEEFLRAWRWDDWNEFRVRCVGRLPLLTTWVNGVQIAELDTATLQDPHYDAAAVADLLGEAGHIALEVHDNDPGMGLDRWAPGAACRWRRIRVTHL